MYSSSTLFFLGHRSHHVSNLDHHRCQQSKKRNSCFKFGPSSLPTEQEKKFDRFEDSCLNIWLEKHGKWFDFHIDSVLFTGFDNNKFNKMDRIMWLYIHIFSPSLFNSLSLIMNKKCFNSWEWIKLLAEIQLWSEFLSFVQCL